MIKIIIKPISKLVPYKQKASMRAVINELRRLRKNTVLGSIDWKELRDAGRK